MYLKHVRYVVSLQDQLIPSHKSHRLLTSTYLSLLFSRLSKQLGRSIGTEFRIILKNSKFTPCREQIYFKHWIITTKANGQTFVILFWIHWIKLWCFEHSVPGEVQFCANVIFRKRKKWSCGKWNKGVYEKLHWIQQCVKSGVLHVLLELGRKLWTVNAEGQSLKRNVSPRKECLGNLN